MEYPKDLVQTYINDRHFEHASALAAYAQWAHEQLRERDVITEPPEIGQHILGCRPTWPDWLAGKFLGRNQMETNYQSAPYHITQWKPQPPPPPMPDPFAAKEIGRLQKQNRLMREALDNITTIAQGKDCRAEAKDALAKVKDADLPSVAEMRGILADKEKCEGLS